MLGELGKAGPLGERPECMRDRGGVVSPFGRRVDRTFTSFNL